MDDPYNLARFVAAQHKVYARVVAELTAGRKLSHWMWFIFPQLKGLGSSPTAEQYGIGSLAEARAYLDHPLLGARLRECTALINGLEGTTAQAIFGYPDHLKFRSSMSLFARAAGEGSVDELHTSQPCAAGARDIERPASPGLPGSGQQPFVTALARYFAGEEDPLTRELLAAQGLRNFRMN